MKKEFSLPLISIGGVYNSYLTVVQQRAADLNYNENLSFEFLPSMGKKGFYKLTVIGKKALIDELCEQLDKDNVNIIV